MATVAQTMDRMGAVKGRAESFVERNRRLFDQQAKARRGPTPEVLFSKHIDNTRIVKADDPQRKAEMRSFTIACAMLFAFVMVYVWQHFSAIEVGYRVEAQKTQVEQLREQNRQLRLQEAQLTDPSRIDQVATQLGLTAPLPGQVVRQDTMDSPTTGTGAVVAQVSLPGASGN